MSEKAHTAKCPFCDTPLKEAVTFHVKLPPLLDAAPDLLKACQRFCANVDHWLETGDPADADESKSIYDQAMDAIKKAGE